MVCFFFFIHPSFYVLGRRDGVTVGGQEVDGGRLRWGRA
eukprot:COSAG06_NODE_18647_length_876_cov_0.548263_3_plen_38_part_01